MGAGAPCATAPTDRFMTPFRGTLKSAKSFNVWCSSDVGLAR